MNCPACKAKTKVIDSRDKGRRRYRRHECPSGHRFTTWELFEEDLLALDGTISTERIAGAVAAALPEFIEAITERLEE